MKSSIVRPRTKIINLLTSSSSATLSSSNKPSSNTGSSSGIPKLTVSSSGGGARPKAGKKPVAAASTPSSASSASTKRFAASSTDKPTRPRIESSSASRIPGKKKLPHSVRPRLTGSSAISKREKPVLDGFGSVTPGRRGGGGGTINSNLGGSRRIGCAPIDKRTVAGMHRSTVAHAATASSGHDKTMKPPPAMASLNRLEREKCELEHRVSELVHNAETKKAEVVNLRGEIGKLKEQNKSRSETVLLENESLHAENQFLRERLEELGFSLDGHTGGRALSDTEKEMLLLSESSKKFKCSSAPPSISGNGNNSASPCCHNSSDDVPFDVEVLSGGAYVAAADVRGSIEWDKQSSSNVSEVSVACLQDRILQMEETHYSTSEELQATLQELSDLQDQLTELQADNERLAEEKAMFLESLCAKVQQLEECRAQLDALRRQFHARESSCTSEQATCHGLSDDRDVAAKLANDVASADEFKRLCSLLEAERFKVAELTLSLGRDANLSATDKSALDQLEAVRRDKERFEARASTLQEQLNVGQCETIRLREQLAVQQEEFAVAKRTAGELEFRLDQALAARDEVNARARELERACRSHSDERRELRKALAELERRAGEEAGRAESSRRQLEEASARHARDAEEWRQFQADLLMAVRVANDFKTEAQRDGERLAAETRTLLDRVQALEAENERLAKTLKVTTSPTFQRSTTTTTTMTSTSSYDMRQSVKSLIETIENASKSGVLDLPQTPSSVPCSPTADKPRPQPILRHTDSDYYVKSPTPSIRPVSADVSSAFQKSQSTNAVRPSIRPSRQRNSYAEGTVANSVNVGSPTTTMERSPLSSKLIGGSVVVVQTAEGCDHGSPPATVGVKPAAVVSPTPVSILANKSTDVVVVKRSSFGESSNEKKDPLAMLARGGGSRRNALLKWCQSRTIGYKGIDITNFSSSWNDGLAFCALVHTYLPDIVPYESLDGKDKRRNFTIAFQAAESVGIPTLLNIGDMISMERPDWQTVMTYVTSIYKHFET